MELFRIVFPVLLCCSCHGFRQLETWKYEEGKRQYGIVERNRNMPKYGQCWTSTIQSLQTSCKEITDELQTRLALSYLNCFLMTQGRAPYMCGEDESMPFCTKDIKESDRASLATFFTHTHNICYFLQSQLWHENTESAITRLSERSDEVADQLEESSILQHEIIHQQNLSLSNQKSILKQAVNLSSVINESTSNIHELFNEYRKTTQEQRVVINEIFDRVSRIQTMIIGEFVGFYSVLMYAFAILICYLFTSTQRTSGARFPVFGIISLNFFVEKAVYLCLFESSDTNYSQADEADLNDRLYQYQWLCRRVSSTCGFVVLVFCACRYRDIGTINNQLLMEIRKQNIELKKALEEGQNKKKSKDNPEATDKQVTTITNRSILNSSGHHSELSGDGDQDDLGYHSNTNIDMTAGLENHVSHTAEKHNQQDLDTCSESSFSTALTGGTSLKRKSKTRTRSSSRSSTLQREIRRLGGMPSFTSLKENILHWAASGCYGKDNQCKESEVASLDAPDNHKPLQDESIKEDSEEAIVTRRYNMRQRRPRLLQNAVK